MTSTQKHSKITFSVLFLSSLGTCLFMSGIVLFLLELGFSAATTSTAIALTAIPNVFFGHILGRWVDRSNKKMMFCALSLYLAGVEILLLKASGWFGHQAPVFAIVALMVAFSFGYSPLMTLIYSYLIPSLDEDEARIFTAWEKASAYAAILAGVVGFVLLNRISAGWLIVLDIVTFLIAGLVIPMIWSPVQSGQEQPPSEASATRPSLLSLLQSLFGDRVLFATAIAMWALALSLSSIENNNLTIGWIDLKLGPAYSSLSTCLFALVSLGGSHWLSLNNERFKVDLMKTQKGVLLFGAVVLILLFTGSMFQSPVLGFISLLAISFIEPTTSVTTNLLIRSRTNLNQIGEVYGLIRMPRALLTIVGTSAIGWSHDAKLFPASVAAAMVVLFIAAYFNHRTHLKQVIT